MQYNNRRASSIARAVIRTTLAVLSMAIIVAFLSSDGTFAGAQWALIGILLVTVLITSSGGLYEMTLQGDNTFLDITCSPVLQPKGRSQTYSIQGDKVLNVSHLNLLFIHKLTVDYIGHHGRHKTARIGLTLMDSRQRDKLLLLVDKIAAHKREAPARMTEQTTA